MSEGAYIHGVHVYAQELVAVGLTSSSIMRTHTHTHTHQSIQVRGPSRESQLQLTVGLSVYQNLSARLCPSSPSSSPR